MSVFLRGFFESEIYSESYILNKFFQRQKFLILKQRTYHKMTFPTTSSLILKGTVQ